MIPASPYRAAFRQRGRAAFTLIELILVMAILATVLGMAAPSLARFFRGRNLDSEATRLVALSRLGQSRAVAEGIPMVLWFDLHQKRYGLRADSTWTRDDGHAVAFDVAEDLELEVRRAELSRTNGTLDIRPESVTSALPSIRFMPDGLFAPGSVEWVQLHGTRDETSNGERLWIAPGWTRLYYEVWTNQPPLNRQLN